MIHHRIIRTYCNKTFFMAFLVCLISVIVMQGCAYRFGAKAFSLKEKIEEPGSEQCTEIEDKTREKTVPLKSIKVKVIKEPSDIDPSLTLSLTRHIINKRMIKKTYDCERKLLWKPKGDYIYDPVEMGFYSTLLTYRTTAQRQEKTLADWIFLSTGWIFAGIDYFTFGIWGVTGGPIIDILIPAWENEQFKTLHFTEKSNFCKMGPITFFALGAGLPVCLFMSDTEGVNNVTEDYTQRFFHPLFSSDKERYRKKTEWELVNIEEKSVPLSGPMIARLALQDSLPIDFHVSNEGVATINLESFSTQIKGPMNVQIFTNRKEKTPLSEVTFNWTGAEKIAEKILEKQSVTQSPSLGSCDDFLFKFTAYGRLESPVFAKVISNNTPLYENKLSLTISESLEFNKNVYIMNVKGSRAAISFDSDSNPVGWTDLSHLLCRKKPLHSESGLHMKFFVNTDPYKNMDVRAYSSEKLKECYNSCQALSHGEGYFVFAENQESYLLSESSSLNSLMNLSGWVRKDKGILWDTSLGLAPQKGTSSLCVYLSQSNALNKVNCKILPFSLSHWHKSSGRIPIIKKDNNLYTVLIPQNMMGNERTVSGYIPVDSKVTEEVLLTSDDLNTWIKFLAIIDSVRNEKAQNLHQTFANVIREAVKEISGKPLIDSEQKLTHVLHEQANFFVREDSPVFKYSLNELSDSDAFPLCAIRRAQKWINHVQEILILIQSGSFYPIPTVVKDYYSHECPSARNIPFVEGPVTTIPRKLEQDNQFFWIPREYLP